MFRNNNKDAHAKTHAHIYKEYESTIYALTAAIDAKDHIPSAIPQMLPIMQQHLQEHLE